MAVRVDAAGNLVGQLAGIGPGRRHAAARLAPRHGARRRRVRRAARRDRRDRRASRGCAREDVACRSPSTCSGSPTRRGCASDRLPRQPRRRRHVRRRARSTLPTTDGVTCARRWRRSRRARASDARRAAASACSATARSTSSRARCSRSATRRSASSRAIAGATRAEVRFTGRAGHAGTVPMDAAARRAPAPCRARPRGRGRGARDAGPGGDGRTAGGAARARPTSCRARRVASLDVRHADDAVRARGGRRRCARAAADRRAARASSSTGTPRLDDAGRRDGPGAERRCWPPRSPGAGLPVRAAGQRRRSRRGRARAADAVAMLFVRCAGGISHHPAESVDAADVGVALDVLDAFLRRPGAVIVRGATVVREAATPSPTSGSRTA